MALVYMELSFTIYDSYSLKDKRSTMKSISKRMHQKYNVSIAEISQQEIWNVGCVGVAAVNSSGLLARKILEQVMEQMEEEYEIEIFEKIVE
ncbi:DUF503 domain-containing protein [Jeotgalibaca sp. MA1X17-3]|uniref:DUF503 domain-containing protein n=1 Tax=Jeotgalibaca sp. MA1X17-3 TaxID=2908211 RepID=UPI001F22E8AB|nr:DUF503 domain-containing protein [Jeotgalibaca sp. MA1X17-3]UJF15552.1 DUF503 domain-containing protein [Jeotgalibaca sp. MA1X17-3]